MHNKSFISTLFALIASYKTLSILDHTWGSHRNTGGYIYMYIILGHAKWRLH